MKQEDLFKKLGLILNELNEQYQFLAQNPQQLSELELELFHANANFLADHVQIIKKISLSNPLPMALAPADEPITTSITQISPTEAPMEDQAQVEEITFSAHPEEEEETTSFEFVEEPIEESTAIAEEIFKLDQSPSTFEFILNDHSDQEKFEFEEKSVDELFNRPLSEEEEQILAQKIKLREKADQESSITEEDEIGPEPFLVHKVEEKPSITTDTTLREAPIQEIETNPATVVEDPSYQPTVNDLLAKPANGSFNSTSGTAVSDLKQSINLNDKLLYIKDLFNGYNLAYAEAIELANKLPNFEAADNFFQKNYAIKNNWAAKQATVDQFYELLNRRFKKG